MAHSKAPSLPKDLARPSPRVESDPTPATAGHGGATSEIEELRERIAKLEAPPFTPSSSRRMVPLGGGFLDAQGRPIMVPAQTDTLADRIVRQEFADENRARNAVAETVRTMEREQREASPDYKPPPVRRPVSFVEMRLAEEKNRGRAPGAMIDNSQRRAYGRAGSRRADARSN